MVFSKSKFSPDKKNHFWSFNVGQLLTILTFIGSITLFAIASGTKFGILVNTVQIMGNDIKDLKSKVTPLFEDHIRQEAIKEYQEKNIYKIQPANKP